MLVYEHNYYKTRLTDGRCRLESLPPPQKSPGSDFLTDGDRETFAPRQFIHDRRL